MIVKNKNNTYNLILFLFAFVLYTNTLTHDYAWDDSIVITENPQVKKGISGIPYLFIKSNSDYKADKYGYRPITLCSFAIEYGLFKNSPSVGHFMNLIYFALLCLVLFKVLQKIFYQYTSLPAFIITLLFIAHPIHVEVVANIKSRDEIFALLFGILSISKMIDFQKIKKIKYLLFAALFFLMAFLSKENAVVFLAIIPIVLLHLQNWTNLKAVIKPAIVLIGLLLVSFCILKLSAASSVGKSASQGAGIYYENGILGNCFFYVDILSGKLANAFCLLFMYLKNFLLPVNLVYFYGYNQIPVASWQQPLVIFSALLHLSALVFAIVKIKTHKEICLGILFYFISIFIYLHVLRPIADTMADRFLFTPSLGLIIVFVFLIGKILKLDFAITKITDVFSLDVKNKSTNTLKYIMVSVTLLLSVATFSRNRVWKNNETLIKSDLPKLENCSRAHSYYADILRAKLTANFDANMEAEMIVHYKKSIAISNEAYYAYLGLSTYLINAKRYDESIVLLDSMLVKFSNQADPNFYMGQALYGKQQYKQALTYLQKSLNLAPEVSNTYFFLALTLSKNGLYAEAEKIINTSKSKFGETAAVYEVLGNIYFDKGDIEQSTKYTFEMLNYGANPEMVYSVIIGRYQTLKQDKPAAFYYQQALQKGLFKYK
jgi:protein O-mannosyl-transferase